MDDLDRLFRAVADSLIEYVHKTDDSKYGPIDKKEKEFLQLVKEGDFEDYYISRLPAGRYAMIKDIAGVPTLLVDTINIPTPVLMQNSDLFAEVFASLGGAPLGNRSGIASSLRDEDSDVNSVYELNASRLPRKLLPVLEEALVLREVERRKSLSRGTVFDWRGEIASSFSESGNNPQTAQHLMSLCSTGYFDEGDVFDQMYSEMVEQGSTGLHEFRGVIGKYVKKNPFAVFVQASGMNGDEVFHLAKSKLLEIDQFPASPEFVDVCGKGSDTHAIIDNARDRLNSETDYQMSTLRNRPINQKILRIEKN